MTMKVDIDAELLDAIATVAHYIRRHGAKEEGVLEDAMRVLQWVDDRRNDLSQENQVQH
jgi:membrane-bound lytic murein transglycosylase B